jgi:hypothetical protein
MARLTLDEAWGMQARESREDAPPDAEAVRARG